MIRVRIDRRWRVDAVALVAAAMPAESLWAIVSDVERFGTHDPFHRAIRGLSSPARTGDRLAIEHGVGPIRFVRRGRLVLRPDRRSWSFSDISARGRRKGFPHVYTYEVLRHDDRSSVLRIRVRGKWTARFVTRIGAWLWITWVMHHIRALTAVRLLRATRRSSGPDGVPGCVYPAPARSWRRR